MAPEFAAEAAQSIAAIRASGYDLRVLRAEVARLTGRNWGTLARMLGEQVTSADRFADAYARAGDARLGPEGYGATSARVAREAVLRPDVVRTAPMTAAEKSASKVLIKDRWNVRELSGRLHNTQSRVVREAYHGAARAVVDGGAMGDAGKRMIAEVERASKGAQTVAEQQRLPKLLEELKRHGNALATNTGDAKTLKAWHETIAKIDRYQATLRTQGRVQAGYLELLERVRRKDGPEMVDQSLDRWLVEKQRYNAERILATEAQAAYRSAQWQRDRSRPWVTGYIWRIQRGGRADYEKRTKPRTIKPPGRQGRGGGIGRGRCVCEVMNGREFSKDAPLDFPHMGHPHCACYWEPIIDVKSAMAAPVTKDEYAVSAKALGL